MSYVPPETEFASDLAALTADRLERMAEAGREVVECHRVLAQTGDNIVGELLREVETFFEWNHYPDGDVYDPTSHAQFYYHAHPLGERLPEHGHFHTFMRPKGMPSGMTPAMVPDFKMPDDPDDALGHIIGISMDEQGLPIRLFSTNRWVTGEVWYEECDVSRLVDRFLIDHVRPSWAVNRWISGMIQLFRPQIIALLVARDAMIAEWMERHPDRNVFEDRDLEVTSYTNVSIDDQMRLIEQAQGAAPSA